MSKGWVVTEKGKDVLREAMELYPLSKEIVLGDESFRNFLVVSGTRIEGMSVNDYLEKTEKVNKK